MLSADRPPGSASVPQRLLLGLLPAWDWLAARRLTLFFLAALLLICGLLVLAAPHRVHRYAQDTFLFLDGGWRVYEGQRPYLDFYSGLGPVTYLLVALGFHLSGIGPAGIDYGFTAAGLILGIWAWVIFRSRTEAPAAFLLALFVVLTGLSPHPMGSRWDQLTYASIYNRLGYALVILVLAEALRAPAPEAGARRIARANSLGGFSSGAACAVAFFLKASFFLVAATLIVSSFLFRDRRSLPRTKGIAAGAVAVALPMMFYLRFDVAAVLSNLVAVAAARTQIGRATLSAGQSVFQLDAWLAVRENGPWFCGLLLLGLLVTVLPRTKHLPTWLDNWWPLAAAAAVCLVDIAFVMTDGVQFAVPLTAAFGLLLISEIYDCWRGAIHLHHLGYDLVCAIGMLLGAAVFFPQMLLDFTSVVYSATVSRTIPPPEARFHEPRLRDFLTRDAPPHWTEPENGRAIVDRVNDGTALLTSSSAPTESVFVLDFVNPFSYGLGRKPPAGGTPYLGGSIFNSGQMPPLERLVGAADLVMTPKHPIDSLLDTWLRQVFQGYIDTHYRLVTESYYWSLYRQIRPAWTPAADR